MGRGRRSAGATTSPDPPGHTRASSDQPVGISASSLHAPAETVGCPLSTRMITAMKYATTSRSAITGISRVSVAMYIKSEPGENFSCNRMWGHLAWVQNGRSSTPFFRPHPCGGTPPGAPCTPASRGEGSSPPGEPGAGVSLAPLPGAPSLLSPAAGSGSGMASRGACSTWAFIAFPRLMMNAAPGGRERTWLGSTLYWCCIRADPSPVARRSRSGLSTRSPCGCPRAR